MKFESNYVVNGIELTRDYIESLDYDGREALVEPIFNEVRRIGFVYPNNEERMKKEYKRLCNIKLDMEARELFNNSSVGTYICKYFCKSFFETTEIKKGKKTSSMVELFNNDEALKRIIRNRQGMDWYKLKGENDIEAFPISARQICFQGWRSKRLVPSVSMFKPEIARWVYEKYSEEGDVVYDYSMGFGGRLLGAKVIGRKYIGVDPLTAGELGEMRDYFGWEDCLLINGCSEDIRLKENSVDLAFSSPPYFSQEVYSENETQAYNKGEDYFYNVYWKNTLDNIKYMLKAGKIFGLNVKNFPKMVEMAEERFELIDQIGLRTIRSHLNKTAGVEKSEFIYIFKN